MACSPVLLARASSRVAASKAAITLRLTAATGGASSQRPLAEAHVLSRPQVSASRGKSSWQGWPEVVAVRRRQMCSMPTAYSGDVDEEDDELLPPPPKVVKFPKRKFMSVADLVAEVEQAMVKGERLEKGGPTYANMQREATRLRMENDTIMSDSESLARERQEFVTSEEEIHERIGTAPGGAADLEALAELTARIKTVDTRLAALRHQQIQNIKEVGAMKRTMSLIEKTAEVDSLVDRVQAFLQGDEEELHLEAEAIEDLAAHLRSEYERASQKVHVYERQISDLLRSDELKLDDEVRDARMKSIPKLYQATRMIAQLSRLVDIQMTNAKGISMLERARSGRGRKEQIRRLVETGDGAQLEAEATFLQEDMERLRSGIKDVEAGLEGHVEEAAEIIAQLRELKDAFTPMTGKLREKLIANLHQEEQWKVQLAVLRGEKVQNLRFLTMVRAALASR